MKSTITLREAKTHWLTTGLTIVGTACAIGLAAQIRIPLPFTPVPITLQTLAVLMAIGLLRERAVLATALYLALGVVGLPLFSAGASGFMMLAGPTGGYLVGFVVAANVCGLLMKNAKRAWTELGCYLLAVVIIFASGAVQLKLFLNQDWGFTMRMGVLPFIGIDLAKAVFAFSSVRGLKALRETFSN